ncbi:MAG: hypothetical protein EXR69_10200 [Myxococcales bacterium]|nr:hypothetical protein [Myxococcales bacterium]
MPSNSLLRWQAGARSQLDEIVSAHAAVAASTPGGHAATEQVIQAYAMLLSSHFQRFCRDLHSEAIEHVCAEVPTVWVQWMLRARLIEGRKLDTGNPNPGNIGSDFKRFGLELWPSMVALNAHTAGQKLLLEQLNRWRNAIAHQDFTSPTDLDLGAGRVDLRLADVDAWRAACAQLAATMDAAVGAWLAGLAGRPPW